ncbi:MAG: FmdB family zinc ribbon protein [Acidimicrobiia bacterium]
MPTYEYRCKSCGQHLEVVQSFTEDALTECPACGGELRKVFGSIGISFKGSGFYKTDSRSGSSRSSTASGASSGTDSPSSSPSSSDGGGGSSSSSEGGSSSNGTSSTPSSSSTSSSSTASPKSA